MPKSFLVKKKMKSKVYSSDSEDENILSEKERNILNHKGKNLLWQPYGNKNKAGEGQKPKDVWSSYTPVDSTPKAVQKSTSLAVQTDAVKHGGEEQISWRNINLPLFAGKESSKEATHQCIRCQRTYTSNAALLKHQRYYCNFYQSRSFTCKYCDKVYLSLGALKMHIRTHTLPCTCMICGKAFSRPWLLQGHVRTHTGEKPYECTSCNRAFADRSNLRAHLQTHSQVKKYKCEQCAKTFSRMSLLIKHQSSTACSMQSI